MNESVTKKQNSVVKKIEISYMLFCSCLLGVSVLICVLTIVLRAVFHISFDFFTDICVWLVIWSGFLLAGPAYGMGAHISIDFIKERLQGRLRLWVDLFNALCALFWVVIVTLGGILMIQRLYSQGQVYPRYIAIPMWIVQICVPIGFFIFTVYVVVEIYKIARKFLVPTEPVEPKGA